MPILSFCVIWVLGVKLSSLHAESSTFTLFVYPYDFAVKTTALLREKSLLWLGVMVSLVGEICSIEQVVWLIFPALIVTDT